MRPACSAGACPLSLHDALPIYLFQELDAVIHLLMEAKHWGLRKSRNATSLNSRFKSLDTLKVKIISRWITRSEERFSRNAETDLVCRLLLEKKKLGGHTDRARA